MATVQAVWGLDVGRAALKAVKLKVSAEGAVQVVAHEFLEHAKILSQPDADRGELITSALEKFLSHHDLSKDKVVVSVPGQHTLARFTKLPPVAPKRIPDIVKYEADQQIPFDMDEVIWDYQAFEQEGLPDIEVGIFAMKRELLREHLLYFEQVAIEPVAVQAAPLAIYNVVAFNEMLSGETTVLLDIGADNTDLVIATPNSLWTRTIPIGGNHFTEALVKAFKLSFSKAESLKRTAESTKYRRQIFQAMRPTFSDIVQELQRSIGFYSSTHREANIDKVVGMGNAFKLPGLQKYLQQNLGMTIEIPSSFKNVSAPAGDSAHSFSEQIPTLAVACGLALQGLEKTKVTSNLLPTEMAKQIAWRKKRPAFAAAAACLVLAGGLIWFRQSTDMSALAAGNAPPVSVRPEEAAGIIDKGPSPTLEDRNKAQQIYDAAKALKAQLAALRGQGNNERTETNMLVQLQRNKTVIPHVLQVIHKSLPTPPDSLATAQSQSEVLAALASGAPPRNQRKQIFIDSLEVQYTPDLHEYEWTSLVQTEPPLNDLDQDLSGLFIKIRCRTPYEEGAKIISDTFMNALRKNGRHPGVGFYFDRVYLFSGSKVEAQGGSATSAGLGFGFPSQAGVHLDVVTNEPTVDDWQFEIWADVILDDFVPSEEDDGESES